ncbi:MAG: Fur family transcriptional regulator [Christensenellales bacterium]|jgi:Fur family peroxide stress response transcriptional regulator
MKQKHSKQREEILQLLRSVDTHPTADWIYRELKPKMPDLSLGTVYRNLSLFVKNGQIQRLTFGSSLDHFDGNPQPHAHFCCAECGHIYDVDFEGLDTLSDALHTTHTIQGCRLEFYGICAHCTQHPPQAAECPPSAATHKKG